MSGSMTSIYLGVSGLQTSQSALNTTGHNIANADTKGYVRQQVIQSDAFYQTIGSSTTSKMQVGYGVCIESVRQIRDRFLDAAYRTEVGRQGFYEAQYNAVSEVEDIFGELEGVSFQDSITSLWNSIQELEKEPDSIVARATLVQSASAFIERAQNISYQLSNYQTSLNTEVKTNVDKVNSLADQINELNSTIMKYESSGVENANDLRDQRNQLLDELGQIVDITYKETASGEIFVYAENHALVAAGVVNHMYVEPISDSSTMYTVKWSDTKKDVFNFNNVPSAEQETDIGYLKGLLLTRGSDKANYTDIPVEPTKPVESDYLKADGTLDQDAYDAAMVEYNDDLDTYKEKLNYYNKVISPSVIMTAQAQFDQLIHGIVTAINDVLCPNKTYTDSDGKVYTVLDTDKAPVGMDANKTPGNALFNRQNTERYVETTMADGTTQYVYQPEDETDVYSLFTIDQIEINEDIKKNYSLIPLSQTGGTGENDAKAAAELSAIWNKQFASLDPNNLSVYTFSGYYTAFIGDIANRGEVYQNISNTQESLVNSIDSQRQAVSGVSTDEELTNMIKYQHAYNAASRYITVVSEMLEHIVTNL